MTYEQLRKRVKKDVRDGAGVLDNRDTWPVPDPDQPDDYDLVLDAAGDRYSRVRPRKIVADLPGTGSWELELPEGWADEWSKPLQVEYPVERREPSLVDRLDWKLYRGPAGTRLRLLADTPPEGAPVRLTFEGLHVVSAELLTVPAADHVVLVHLAASLGCEQLASHYSNSGDSTVLADSVQHTSKAREYAARAKRFMGMANELLPIQEQGEVRAAGGTTSWGDDMPLLTHPRR
jgi:hypothetical protein